MTVADLKKVLSIVEDDCILRIGYNNQDWDGNAFESIEDVMSLSISEGVLKISSIDNS